MIVFFLEEERIRERGKKLSIEHEREKKYELWNIDQRGREKLCMIGYHRLF